MKLVPSVRKSPTQLGMEVEDAIRSGEIIAQYKYQESERCDEVQIQAYDPRIFVALGMCEDRLVVITTWWGEK